MKKQISSETEIFLYILIFFFSACECIQRAEGIILDKDSKLPIGNVLFFRDEITHGIDRSNAIGEFKFEDGMRGATPGCPSITLYFYKEGYEPVKVTYDAGSENDTVLLKKVKH
jgi:hypothetical protein